MTAEWKTNSARSAASPAVEALCERLRGAKPAVTDSRYKSRSARACAGQSRQPQTAATRTARAAVHRLVWGQRPRLAQFPS